VGGGWVQVLANFAPISIIQKIPINITASSTNFLQVSPGKIENVISRRPY